MNFVEAMELLRALSKFFRKNLRICPKLVFYDSEKEGYTIFVKEDSVKPDYLIYMKEIVETRQLRIKNQEGYLAISSL
jgi:hypothetical protein